MKSNRPRRAVLLSIPLLVGVFCLPGLLRAQTSANAGEIAGQLLDPSGAVISGGQVALLNKNTNYLRAVATDAGGRYTVPQLPLGPYQITATANGFGTQIQEASVTLAS